MASYVTAVQMAEYLQIPNLTASIQSKMERAIATACAQINGLCGRTFDAVDETRYFTPISSGLVEVGFLASVTSIEIDSLSDFTYATLLNASEYILTTNTGRRYLTLNSTSSNTLPLSPNSVKIVGKFGPSAPPPEIQQATLLQASRLYKRADSVLGEIRGDQGFMRVSDSFDPDARQILKDAGWMRNKGGVFA